MRHDPYDVRNAFDDVLGAPNQDIIDMAGATIQKLSRQRLLVPSYIDVVGEDVTPFSFTPVGCCVIGGEEAGLPLFSALREKFRYAVGSPKLVRVDDEQSYKDFRNARKRPYLDSLEKRLALLEAAHASRQAHEDYFDHDTAEHDAEVIGAVTEAAKGGKSIALALPVRGKVEAWLDGDEVLLSARFPHAIVTTGSMLVPELAALVGCAEHLGADSEDALVMGTTLAPVLLGQRLLGDLCRAADDLMRRQAPFVGVLRPETDVDLASAMTLLQRGQTGDRQALREAHEMAHSHKKLVRKAARRLEEAQREKRRRLS